MLARSRRQVPIYREGLPGVIAAGASNRHPSGRRRHVIKAFFLAIGVFAIILGVECLVLDRAVLAASQEPTISGFAERMASAPREFTPPEWAAWSLLSVGAVVILYSFTLPQKSKSG
jgi:hypothetical protein